MTHVASDLEAGIRTCLEKIYDPCSVTAGTPISIYDMGLLAGWTLSEAGKLTVTLCVTYGACTMAPHFVRTTEESISALPGIREVEVVVDHEVIWSQSRLSPKGRDLLANRPHRFTAKDMPRPRQWQEVRVIRAVQ